MAGEPLPADAADMLITFGSCDPMPMQMIARLLPGPNYAGRSAEEEFADLETRGCVAVSANGATAQITPEGRLALRQIQDERRARHEADRAAGKPVAVFRGPYRRKTPDPAAHATAGRGSETEDGR